VVAGLVSLGFLFVLRLGGIAPFPPESALEAFLKIIPEKIQEPSVQQLGDFAVKLGLILATVVSAAVYGGFGVLFKKWYSPRITTRSISRPEKFLIFSIIPFLFFGLLILPLSGDSIFGISSSYASSSSILLFPFSLFLGSAIFGGTLDWLFGIDTLHSKEQRPTLQQKELPAASRRSFVEKGVLALGALVLLLIGIDEILTSQSQIPTNGPQLGTPINSNNEPSVFEDAQLASLVNSEVTANDHFYQVDIDLFSQHVDASTWSLQVTGLVQNPRTYSLSELQALPKTLEYNTFECVSNDVNGNLINNAGWRGITLSDLFSDVGGVLAGAVYVVFYSVDGYSVGIPLSKAMMTDSMLAYEMNSVPLPAEHGFPLRAVIPGLYGMMSAKWIRKISVVNTTYLGYWQTRGWSDDGTVETLAFITTAHDGSSQNLSANNGTAIVGGYAYAGARGISKVEVSTDGAKTWQPAVLKPPISNDTWALWAFEWTPAQTGSIKIYARATDGTGAVQTSTESDTYPSGATGYASITIKLTK
jgi:DMSO/TMAO reductase YedYZ molybdopterin-dependent catalytic subunit